ncbi:hypothetical protein FRC02_000947 [Tulasnella sp. 418]|nr:hypothetical protein FRC02_000947 [Tulasnella sp. 418]
MTAKIQPLVAGLLTFLAATGVVDAFSFSFSSRIQQCSSLSVTWDGGTPPYVLNLIPVGALSPEIRTIVDETILSGNSHNFQLRFPTGSSFIAMMSDATGIGTGGTSNLITVLDGPSDCLATSGTSPLFYIFIEPVDRNPAQCGSLQLGYAAENATNPVRLTAIVPGGESINIPIPSSGQPFNWQVPFPQGTQYMIMGGDARGIGTGGSSVMYTVQSGSNGCINQDSPSSTQAPAAGGIYATGSGGGTVTGAPGSSPKPSDPSTVGGGGGSKSNVGPIVGGVLGGVAAILLLLLLFLFLRRRRNAQSRKNARARDSVDLLNEESANGGRATVPATTTAAAVATTGNEADDGTGQSMMSHIPAPPASTRRSMTSISGSEANSAPIYAQYSSKRGSAPSLPPLRLSADELGTESGYATSTHQALKSIGAGGHRGSNQFPPSAFRNAGERGRPQTPTTSEDTSLNTPHTPGTNRASKQGLPPPGTLRPVNIIQHEDGGEVPTAGPAEEVVELPPSYNDVSRNSTGPISP